MSSTSNSSSNFVTTTVNVSYLTEEDWEVISTSVSPATNVTFLFEFDEYNHNLLIWDNDLEFLSRAIHDDIVFWMGALARHFQNLRHVRIASTFCNLLLGRRHYHHQNLVGGEEEEAITTANNNPNNNFPVIALSDMLRQHSTSLVSLQVDLPCHLEGRNEDFDFVLRDFDDMTSITTIDLWGSSDYKTTPANQHPLWSIIDDDDGILEYHYSSHDAYVAFPGWLSVEYGGVLCRQITRLEHVAIPPNIQLEPDKFLYMLRRGKNLISLKATIYDGPANWSNQAAKLFHRAISKTKTLKTLELYWFKTGLSSMASTTTGNKAVAALLSGLEKNKSLSSFKIHLYGYSLVDSDVCFGGFAQILDKVLETNLTLQQVEISRTKLNFVGMTTTSTFSQPAAAVSSTTTNNTTAGTAVANTRNDGSSTNGRYDEVLQLGDASRFWLKANKKGRKELFQDATTSEDDDDDHQDDKNNNKRWLSTLIKEKDDTQFVYYLLSHNISVYLPHLLCVDTVKSNANNSTKSKKHSGPTHNSNNYHQAPPKQKKQRKCL